MRSVQFLCLMLSSLMASMAYTLPDGRMATMCVLSLNSCMCFQDKLLFQFQEVTFSAHLALPLLLTVSQGIKLTLKVTGQCQLPLVFLAMLRRRMSLVVMGSPVMGLFLCCTRAHMSKQDVRVLHW